MSNTAEPISEVSDGLENMKPVNNSLPALRPWEIAELPLFHFPNGQTVDVEHASDQEFEAWVVWHGIPVDNSENVAGWNFDLRCMLINHCRQYGLELTFPIEFGAESEQNGAELEQVAPNGAEEGIDHES